MCVVSTDSKWSIPLVKMVEEGANDSVFGRVWFTYAPTIREFPDVSLQRQVTLPNFTHIACGCQELSHLCILYFDPISNDELAVNRRLRETCSFKGNQRGKVRNHSSGDKIYLKIVCYFAREAMLPSNDRWIVEMHLF